MKLSKHTEQFNSTKSITENVILIDKEKNILLNEIHNAYGHKGFLFTRNEILKCRLIWKNYTTDVNIFLRKCII